MKVWIRQLDEILRGETTRPRRLQPSVSAINAPGIAIVIVALAVSYGLCMGSFALARGIEIGTSRSIQQGLLQTVASMLKMPVLFLSTLLITFPSLYVFSALAGSRMKVGEVMRLLVAALAVNLAVLASLGPIVAFFSVSTPNYFFVLLLNVGCCGLAGTLGLWFLTQALHRLSDPALQSVPAEEQSVVKTGGEPTRETTAESLLPPGSPEEIPPGPLRRSGTHATGRHVQKVVLVWIVVFGLVGSQMGWVLRPFIGSPTRDFTWFRSRESSILEAVGAALQGLFG